MNIKIDNLDITVSPSPEALAENSYIVFGNELHLVVSLSPLKVISLSTKEEQIIEGDFQPVTLHTIEVENIVYSVVEDKEILPYDLVMDRKLELYDSPPVTIDTELICEYLISKKTKRPKFLGNLIRPFVLVPVNGNQVIHKRNLESIIEDLTLIINFVKTSELNVSELHKLQTVRAEVTSLKEEVLSLKSK